jgi:hypothetical protein
MMPGVALYLRKVNCISITKNQEHTMTPEQKKRLQVTQEKILEIMYESGLSHKDNNADNITLTILILININSKILGSLFAYGNTDQTLDERLIDDMTKEIKESSQEIKLMIGKHLELLMDNSFEKVH